MKNSNRSAALRQHASAKVSRPSQAAPVAADPVEWSTGDPIIRDALNEALPKLIAAGTNLPDAIAVLRDLSKASERAELKLADELGQMDDDYKVDSKSAVELFMAAGENVEEILGDAKRFMAMADRISEAAHEADDAKWLALASSFLCGLAVSYNGIAIRAIGEGRSHG